MRQRKAVVTVYSPMSKRTAHFLPVLLGGLAMVLPLPMHAALSERALVVNVAQEQIQQSLLNARTSDGRRDRSVKRIRVLNVDARAVGSRTPERVNLRWFFIGKSPLSGKFDYYSKGAKDVTLPAAGSLKLRLVSEPLEQNQYYEQEFLTSIHVTAGDIPQGWIVEFYQDGKRIYQTASESGLLEWMTRNPPPTS